MLRVGQQVRVIRNDSFHGEEIGSVITVNEIEQERVMEVTQELLDHNPFLSPRFEVGDTIVATFHSEAGWAIGEWEVESVGGVQ